MHATASRLLTRARSAGAISADLDAADLLALANGIALASADAEQAERCLAFLRRGTTPAPCHQPTS